jgi:hypothetical protein
MGLGLDIRHSAQFDIKFYPNHFQQNMNQALNLDIQIRLGTSMSNVEL